MLNSYIRIHWIALQVLLGVVALLGLAISVTLAADDPAPAGPALVAPADNAVVSSPVKLSWTAAGAGAYRYWLQISRTEAFDDLAVNYDGITSPYFTLQSLSVGTKYWWRVRSLTTTTPAIVSNWSSVRAFTVQQEAPATAVPAIPKQLLPKDGTIEVGLDPELSWYPADRAASYTVQVSKDENFSVLVFSKEGLADVSVKVISPNSTDTQIIPVLQLGTRYFWRVRAVNAAGAGAWSTIWRFTTRATATTKPAAPTLATPVNMADAQPTMLTLTWHAAERATGYWLQISTSPIFNAFVVSQAYTSRSANIAGLKTQTTYYWRVAGKNAAGSGDWSPVWSFTTRSADADKPVAPILLSPGDAATQQEVTPRLTWEAAERATAYRLQIATNETFTGVLIEKTFTTTTADITGLSAGTVYYWRVAGQNASGTGPWSTVWRFTTKAAVTAKPIAPLLVSPTNGSKEQPTTLTLTWNAIQGAETYWVQVSASPVFIGTIVNKTYSDTVAEVSGLTPSMLYYWRVAGKNALGEGVWSTAWTFTTKANTPPPTKPAAPTLSSPAAEAIGVALIPTLSWSAVQTASSYTVQVATNNAFTTGLIAREGVTATSLTLISEQMTALLEANTNYFWRVRAVNDVGAGDWSTTRSFTTQADAVLLPAVPQLYFPGNGAVDIVVTPALTWYGAARAEAYALQVARDAAFTDVVINQLGMTGTSYTVGVTQGMGDQTVDQLTVSTKYYWRVRAINLSGASDWSTTWNFTTKGAAPTTKPDAPELASPENQATDQLSSLRLTWSAAARAASYRLQISRSSSFSSISMDQTQTTLFADITGLSPGVTYYWRVAARNALGDSPWSSSWSFTTKAEAQQPIPPAKPQLYTPYSGVTGAPLDVQLTWYAADRATTYTVQLAKNETFTIGLITRDEIAGTSVASTPLDPGSKYFWRVRAVNAAGVSDWSLVWHLTTMVNPETKPPAPQLYSPLNGAVEVSVTPYLIWYGADRATSYTVQVASDEAFTNVVFAQDGLTANSVMVTGPKTATGQVQPLLAAGTTYFWRVRAVNAYGASDWSSRWSFTTKGTTATTARPTAPVLSFPGNGATDQPTTLRLSWNAAERAASYWLQVSGNPNFSGLVVNKAIYGLSADIAGFVPGTTYYWRVMAKNASGEGPWSAAWSFTIKAGDALIAPSVPTLYFPANNAANVATIPTLAWIPAERASTYTVQVSRNATFTDLVQTKEGVTGTTLKVQAPESTDAEPIAVLAAGTRYYWRVKAVNDAGSSQWSTAWNFTTQAPL